MFRIYNLAKRKKGVSPVIAVVLLIALTVAAAAVIWAITQGLIGGAAGAVSYNVTDTTSATATVRVEISITADATIASANLVNSTNTYLVDAINPTALTANDEAIV
ncbi:MAG: archaellin/type IV pilin N-terminal domain-containing protein, partial [Candidatus Kariarchaeaceae archaeon]